MKFSGAIAGRGIRVEVCVLVVAKQDGTAGIEDCWVIVRGDGRCAWTVIPLATLGIKVHRW